MFITAILEIVCYNSNKKSPRARSLNCAGNEYDFEYVFFVLSRNDENDILAKYAFFKRLRTYNDMMETVVESWYNKGSVTVMVTHEIERAIQIDGIINLKKEAGMTSHDVVFKLRKILGTKKIGHGGTLDPDVVGVLPIAVGKATRMVEFMRDECKIYEGEITLGFSTTTEDASGV